MGAIRITLQQAEHEQGHPERYRPSSSSLLNQSNHLIIQVFHHSRVADPSLESEAAQFFSQGGAPSAFNLSGLSAALPPQQTPAIRDRPSSGAPWKLPAQALGQYDATMQGWATNFLAAEQNAQSPIGLQLVREPMVNANVPQHRAFPVVLLHPRKHDDFY